MPDSTDKKPAACRDDSDAASLPAITRRRALGVGAGAAVLAALGSATAGEVSRSDSIRERSFDEDWLFYRGDASGASAPSFNDRGWRGLDLPHDWRIEDLPYAHSDDGAATSDPSVLMLAAQSAPDPTAPSVIGPFDVNADPVPDLDVEIPGFGRIVFPGGRSQGYTVGGIGWYRKHFKMPELQRRDEQRGGANEVRRIELRFDAVYQNADVWLNGVHLGFHPNGYTSFAFDLTPHLNRNGDNVLAVRVDNRGKPSRWYSGSGIYQHTWLTVTGPIRIPLWGVRVTTPTVDERNSVARVEVKATNAVATTDVRVRMTVIDPKGRPVATQTTARRTLGQGMTDTHVAELSIPRAALWSPEDPNLYRVRTDVLVDGRSVDSVTTTFGIRSLVFNGTVGFLLNGKPFQFRGGNIHHDHGPIGTVAIDRAEERTVEVMKAAGFNSLRGAHNPRSPALLDACDRLGMLVYNEFTDVWDVPKLAEDYHVHFPNWWERDLTSMVVRDRNHPSVVIWSIGNEISADPNNYGPRLAALVRSLDTTRPVALGGQNVGQTTNAWDYVDVGDFHGLPTPAIHAAHPEKAIIQSENTVSRTFTEWKFLQENSPWYIGSLVWAGWDYIGEAGSGPAVVAATFAEANALGFAAVTGKVPYPYFNDFQCDIDLIGQRKPQNYWRSVVNGNSPLEMLVARPTPPGKQQWAVWYAYYDELPSWTWGVPQGQAMVVHVYTLGDSVTLLLNGQPVATKPVVATDARLASFDVPYAPGELTAVASLNGKEIARRSLVTVGAAAAIRLKSDVKSLTTSRGELAHVLVEVVDRIGRVVPDATVKVNFLVRGAGELIGAANGNPHNVDSFKRPRHHTWHGKALAILRPAIHPGPLTLTATADGLRSDTLVLRVSQEDDDRESSRVSLGSSSALVLGGLSKRLGQRTQMLGSDASDNEVS